jgi:hypothetical protein
MNNFDVELDSYQNRFHVVRWISRDETLRESFNKAFVLRFLAHFMIRSLRIWAWSLNRRVRLTEDLLRLLSKLAWFEKSDAVTRCDVFVLRRERNSRIFWYIFIFLNLWSSHASLVLDMHALQKFFFREIYRADQAHQNLVLLLSIRRKLIVQYCFKDDHVLKLLSFSNFSFRTLVNKLKYIKLKALKDDHVWNNTVQWVFVWLIKAKRDFDELDQLYKFHEKNFV